MKKLILLCLLMGATSVFAQSVATVLFTAKKVVVNHNGAVRAITRGATLEAGDTIITSADARANIKYLNGTLVNLGDNTNYRILSYSPSADVQIKAELNSGKMRFKTTGNKNETLKTPVIALAILGTSGKVYATSGTTNAELWDGSMKAGDKQVGPGESILATPSGVTFEPFPPAGEVSEPKDTEGYIDSGDNSQASVDQDIDVSEIALINTNQTVGTAVEQAVLPDVVLPPPVETLADISIECPSSSF